jgi:deoxyhypusine synthase
MDEREKEHNAREFILGDSEPIEGKVIEGYDFNSGVNYEGIVKSYSSTGFQASNFSKSIDIVNEMIAQKTSIFLGYTSNMISSGLRESIRYLFEKKMISVGVTSAGGVEEDIIKCLGNCVLGEFKLSGKELRDKGLNRIGNVLAPNINYVKFEEFMMPLLEELYQEQLKTGKIISPSELIWAMGKKIDDKRSVCYWAMKNEIPIFCPAVTDGSLGDMIYFFKFRRPEFKIDIAEDIKRLNDSTNGLEKTGVLLLGSGVVKHSILNANLYRNGTDYAVYINTSQEFDGSDSGAMPDEAVSWGKIRVDGKSVKVFGDATILFPILMAETFAKSI